jgi:hypothetical protein
LNKTGPAVRPVKDRTRASTGPVQLKRPVSNRTAIIPVNRRFFIKTNIKSNNEPMKNRAIWSSTWDLQRGREERRENKKWGRQGLSFGLLG